MENAGPVAARRAGAVGLGLVVGFVAGVAPDPAGGFAIFAGTLCAVVGALAVGSGWVGAEVAAALVRRRGRRTAPWASRAPVATAGLVAGAVAAAALGGLPMLAPAVLVGSALSAVTAAGLVRCARRPRRPAAV